MLPITGSNPFKWRHYRGDIILWCVRWYLRYPISLAHMSEMAITDPLTGLANHGEMQSRLAFESGRLNRYATLQAAGYKGTYAFREKIDIEGLNHPKRMFDLAEGLIRRRHSDSDIELILGGNFKRALTAIWTV